MLSDLPNKRMNWRDMIENMYREMKQLLSQREMEQLVDDLTVMIYKDKKKDEGLL